MKHALEEDRKAANLLGNFGDTRQQLYAPL